MGGGEKEPRVWPSMIVKFNSTVLLAVRVLIIGQMTLPVNGKKKMIKTETTETYVVAACFTNYLNWLCGADGLVGITDRAFLPMPPELPAWCSWLSGNHSPKGVIGITF